MASVNSPLQLSTPTQVESYIESPLIPETIVTEDEPEVSPPTFTTDGYVVIGNSYEDCVSYAKRITGINRPIGNGARAGINTQIPRVGEIVAERKYVHAAVVENITSNGVVVSEANFVPSKIDRRFIPFSDILGYII